MIKENRNRRRRRIFMVVNWGILSTANIGKKAIIPALKNVKNANVAAIASRTDTGARIAKELEIPRFYSSYEELLDDPTIHAVYIPLPNTLHKEWVIKAAEKGKHVLCEKPAALNSEDVKEMIKVCQNNNVLFMEAFMYQFQPQHERVKELIHEGEIGDIRHIRSTFTFKLNYETSKDNIRLNSSLGGGCIWDVGCYCIHVTRYLLDKEPIQVYVTGNKHPDFEVETNAAGLLLFDGDIMASFDCSFEQPMTERYEVLGTKGSIVAPYAFRSDRHNGGMGELIIKQENGEERIEKFPGNQYEMQVQHFTDCVLLGEQPRYSGEKTLRNIQVIEACYESLKQNKPIKL
jgi:D-xylose 1-dehydrogenase (NADP+, D-xylono-1,5-lactone-forming)